MPLQTPADASNKHNRRPTSTRGATQQHPHNALLQDLPMLFLPNFLCFQPYPGYAVCSAGIPWAAREVPGRQVGSQATHEVCSQLTHRFWASPHGQPHHQVATLTAVSHFSSSSSISPQYLWCSPTTLLLQTDLKLHQVPKISSHWHQWFRGKATISRNVYNLSYLQVLQITVYWFTLHPSQEWAKEQKFVQETGTQQNSFTV